MSFRRQCRHLSLLRTRDRDLCWFWLPLAVPGQSKVRVTVSDQGDVHAFFCMRPVSRASTLAPAVLLQLVNCIQRDLVLTLQEYVSDGRILHSINQIPLFGRRLHVVVE